MNYIFILFAMIFLHIVDDYYLQGILAKMKQKQWWEDNAPDDLYKYDYIPALIAHGFSWSFVTMLPLVIYELFIFSIPSFWYVYTVMLLVNTFLHSYVDTFKANFKVLNLIADQLCHLTQIIVTWVCFMVIGMVIA
jgi:hypothetical protein